MIPAFDASWAAPAALLVGAVLALMILKIIAAVYSQALAHYDLALDARLLRRTHLERLREIEQAIKREQEARAAKIEARSQFMHDLPDEMEGEVGVDILQAA